MLGSKIKVAMLCYKVSIIEVANASCQLKHLNLYVESKTLAILITSLVQTDDAGLRRNLADQ